MAVAVVVAGAVVMAGFAGMIAWGWFLKLVYLVMRAGASPLAYLIAAVMVGMLLYGWLWRGWSGPPS